MILLISWIIFGLFVGLIAKLLHPGPTGFFQTVMVGVVGSFIGGFLNWFIWGFHSDVRPAGFLMSVVGGVIFCAFWRWYILKFSPEGPKSFFTGKNLK